MVARLTYLAVLAAALVLSGCATSELPRTLNKAEYWKVTRAMFPKAEIVESPGSERGFIVLNRDGELWWVEFTSPYFTASPISVLLMHPWPSSE